MTTTGRAADLIEQQAGRIAELDKQVADRDEQLRKAEEYFRSINKGVGE